jgi:hypothetical protein
MAVSLRSKHCVKNISAQAACHAATREYFREHKTNPLYCFVKNFRGEMTIRLTFAPFASLREIFRFFGCGFAVLGLSCSRERRCL